MIRESSASPPLTQDVVKVLTFKVEQEGFQGSGHLVVDRITCRPSA